jgi:hypothetical protein
MLLPNRPSTRVLVAAGMLSLFGATAGMQGDVVDPALSELPNPNPTGAIGEE